MFVPSKLFYLIAIIYYETLRSSNLSFSFPPLKNFLKAAIIPRELREILSPPLTYENHVCLAVDSECNTFSFAKLVDSLLWVSPRAETVSIKYNDCDHEFSFQVCIFFVPENSRLVLFCEDLIR